MTNLPIETPGAEAASLAASLRAAAEVYSKSEIDGYIPALAGAGALADADQIQVVQGGAAKRGPLSGLWTYVKSKFTGEPVATAGVTALIGLDGNGGMVRSVSQLRGVKDRSAVGDGLVDDTTPFANWTGAGGAGFIQAGTYLMPGAVGTPPDPRVIIADDNATHDGILFPLLSISRLPTKNLPQHYVYVRQDNLDRDDEWTVRFDRLVNADPAYPGGRALQVTTDVNVNTDSTEWAISGVLNNHSNTASLGNAALSGVANKYGTASVFGGHLQANDYNTYALATDVTPVIGFESNIQAIGVDHPTANNGIGNRRVADILPYTLSGAAAAAAEIGVGVLIRNNAGASNAYFRYGLAIDEPVENTNHMLAGIFLRTGGARGIDIYNDHSTADIHLRGNSGYGILFGGTYSTAAIRLNQSQYIAMEATATIKTGYIGATAIWGFYSGANERVGLDMSANPNLRVAGTKVVGSRDTGWTADTGTAKKTANATYSGTAEVSYTQATIQTLMNAVRDATQTQKAMKDALISHGLIGA